MNYALATGSVKLPEDYVEHLKSAKNDLYFGKTIIFQHPKDFSSIGKAGDDFWYSVFLGYIGDGRLMILKYDEKTLKSFQYCISGYSENDIKETFSTFNELVTFVKRINRKMP